MSTSWIKKKTPAINKKLRDAIIDVLPLDIKEETANIILLTIFNTIVKGVKRDGFVTIEGLGRFFRQDRPAHYRGSAIRGRNGRLTPGGLRYTPANSYVNFKSCLSLIRALTDKEDKKESDGTTKAN